MWLLPILILCVQIFQNVVFTYLPPCVFAWFSKGAGGGDGCWGVVGCPCHIKGLSVHVSLVLPGLHCSCFTFVYGSRNEAKYISSGLLCKMLQLASNWVGSLCEPGPPQLLSFDLSLAPFV
ncbi:hypothetical protein XENOCAPTIV_024886 [Xenoophorus captivus]|uniref:Secreted protein n=1 Tax=Xenoophorus captivus TaxID=1517983 RepID=A0ABV0S8K7_9TELE